MTLLGDLQFRQPAQSLEPSNVALALTDISRMPRPWEKKQFDWVTTDFVYVRWLGDRKGMETLTTTWDKTIINRTDDLQNWAGLFRQFVSRNLKVYAYANNHYAGHGPDTRSGNPRWRRVTELRARTAKSVFHFDVQGSVAKSAHAGIPWLRCIRHQLKDRVHFWPFDGWSVPSNR